MESILNNKIVVNSNIPPKLINLYLAGLADKPYCSNTKAYPRILPQRQALEYLYIQPHQPLSQSCIVLDIDYISNESLNWSGTDLLPNIIIYNPINGHSHYFFFFSGKIWTGNIINSRAENLMHDVEHALIQYTGADIYCPKILAKNPLHKQWVTQWKREEEYTLKELHDNIPSEYFKKSRKNNITESIGRNVTLFNSIRIQAYNVYLKSKFEISPDELFNLVYELALEYNIKYNIIPLPEREVYNTAKSITKWTVNNMSKQNFSQIQRERADRLAKIRKNGAEEKYIEIRKFKADNPNMSNRKIAIMLGTSEGTIRTALKIIGEN